MTTVLQALIGESDAALAQYLRDAPTYHAVNAAMGILEYRLGIKPDMDADDIKRWVILASTSAAVSVITWEDVKERLMNGLDRDLCEVLEELKIEVPEPDARERLLDIDIEQCNICGLWLNSYEVVDEDSEATCISCYNRLQEKL